MTAVKEAPLQALGYGQLTCSASTLLSSISVGGTAGIPRGATQALIQCTGAAVRWRDDGTAPTTTTGNSLAVGATMIFTGDLYALRFIQVASTAVVDVSFYK